MIDVIVVGAGASGLMAAIQAARCGKTVRILEHMERPGKKLSMTGNGKCNFTNEQFQTCAQWQDEISCSYFHGACPAFVLPALCAFDLRATLSFFAELGIAPISRRGGYYPASAKASDVLEVLLLECARLGVGIEYEIGIRSILQNKKKTGFVLETKQGTYQCRRCILATGGKSYKKTGSDGSGFLYAKRLGHTITPLLPALVPLQSDLTFFKKTAGIRAEVTATLCIDGAVCATERGELQLTDYGLSGICIFQFSSLAAQALAQLKAVTVQLNFLPDLDFGLDLDLDSDKDKDKTKTKKGQQAYEFFSRRFSQPCAEKKTAAQAMRGLFAEQLGTALLEEAGIAPNSLCRQLKEKQIQRLVHTVQQFSVPITGTRSFDQAQVTAGGVSASEICAETMESKLIPGLYFAGEMLDIDGICGGFNLQWAWSSGALAGMQTAASIERRTDV